MYVLYQKYYNQTMIIAAILGAVTGYIGTTPNMAIAGGITTIFVHLLELLSIPLIFLSIVSTISGMQSYDDMKVIGRKALKYTLLTTILSAVVGLILFLIINPVVVHQSLLQEGGEIVVAGSYSHFILNLVPSNIVQLFSNNGNVVGIMFFSILVSFSILGLPQEQRIFLHTLFSSLFAMILKIAQYVIMLLPFGVFGFVAELFHTINNQGQTLLQLFWYAVCILLANVVQGCVILPLLLWYKGIAPKALFKSVIRALTMAFFSKSSNTTLPVTLSCATQKAGISQRVASFVLPLCTTINMNGCAAFMLITVLFVLMSHGVAVTNFDMIAWVFIVTIAAIGNAGIPMGCYFLASAFLASMNVPLYLLGAILPLYTFFDMVETALNVWSDIVVAAIVDKELKD